VEEPQDHSVIFDDAAAVPDTFRIAVEQRDSHALMTLEGPVDLEAAASLRVEVERLLGGSAAVRIDWHAAGHFCAGAIQVLLALGAALTARGGSLSVAGDNPDIRRFLELAGLSGHFPVREQSA